MMSLAGDLRPYTARELIEEACSRAGIPPARLTSEIVEKSLDQLNLIFSSLVNRGVQLWKRQKIILPCYMNTRRMPLPPGANNVVTLNRRTLFRQIGTPFTSDGGDASLAFDDDFETECVQITPNGSLGCTFTDPIQITTVGVLFGAAGSYGLFFEYSNDGVTWFSLDAASVTVGDREWFWYDLDGAPQALQWRVRSVGDTPFEVRELFFGNTPQEINLGQWNLDEYSNMPNQMQGGQVDNWYQQRDRGGPVLYVWPVPNELAKYDTLVCWVSEMLLTVTQATQEMDVPSRWYDAITAMMARRLCRSLEEGKMDRYPMLVAEEGEAVALAVAEERDPAPTNYDPGTSYYTNL